MIKLKRTDGRLDDTEITTIFNDSGLWDIHIKMPNPPKSFMTDILILGGSIGKSHFFIESNTIEDEKKRKVIIETYSFEGVDTASVSTLILNAFTLSLRPDSSPRLKHVFKELQDMVGIIMLKERGTTNGLNSDVMITGPLKKSYEIPVIIKEGNLVDALKSDPASPRYTETELRISKWYRNRVFILPIDGMLSGEYIITVLFNHISDDFSSKKHSSMNIARECANIGLADTSFYHDIESNRCGFKLVTNPWEITNVLKNIKNHLTEEHFLNNNMVGIAVALVVYEGMRKSYPELFCEQPPLSYEWVDPTNPIKRKNPDKMKKYEESVIEAFKSKLVRKIIDTPFSGDPKDVRNWIDIVIQTILGTD